MLLPEKPVITINSPSIIRNGEIYGKSINLGWVKKCNECKKREREEFLNSILDNSLIPKSIVNCCSSCDGSGYIKESPFYL